MELAKSKYNDHRTQIIKLEKGNNTVTTAAVRNCIRPFRRRMVPANP